jgi:hypothetical protein
MSRESYIRASIAVGALELFPRRMRGALISSASFRQEYGVTADAVFSLEHQDAKFQRSSILEAVRRSFVATSTVADLKGEQWRVEYLADERPPTIVLFNTDRRLAVVHLVLLSPNPDVRLTAFRTEATRVNLPSDAIGKWETLLRSRPPDDDELGDIQDDLNCTPISRQRQIQDSLARGVASLSTLVPRSEKYYERLVGKFEDGQTFGEFVEHVAKPHMQRLIQWRAFEGFQFALLLASQPKLAALLVELDFEPEQLNRIYDWLVADGDVLSCAAAIEAGLTHAQITPSIQEALSRLIESFVLPKAAGQIDPFKLLSSVIVAVYGEIANTRVSASKPPYWRRLAAIAQAILIVRSINVSGLDPKAFADWVGTVRAEFFLLQCYVDLRLEPRWLPDLILSDQWKHELGGRVLAAANTQAAFVRTAGWYTLLLDEVATTSLRKQLDIPRAFLPGPLEGGMDPQLEIPAVALDEMLSDLSQPVVTAASFSGLGNSSLLFKIPPELADLAADAITRANYELDQTDKALSLAPHLFGLASVTSVTRSRKLADALFVLLRKYRQFYPSELKVEDAFRIAMIASASCVELSEWCKCVGNILTQLSFEPIAKEDAARLHSHVMNLCHIVPELWASCGQAEAALKSILSI